MCEDKKWRLIIKQGSGVPTVPASSDHRDGTWLATDIYEGEQYQDTDTGKVWTRNGSDIIESGGGMLYTEIDVTALELLAINGTPIAVLPAPGAGKYYDYEGELEYTFNTTPYTVSGGGDLYLTQGDKDYYFPRLMIAESVDTAANGTHYGFKKTNTALTLTSDANPTLGDGTLKLKIWYIIRTLG